MKKIYLILTALLSGAAVLVGCTDNTPFSTATADDEPRIIEPSFPNRTGNDLPVLTTINRDENFTEEIIVTPADFTTVVWYIDGAEVHQGTELDMSLLAGTYTLKIIATTTVGKSTSREALVQVNPLEGDPATTTVASERFISPGAAARLYGVDLDKAKSIIIGGNEISATYNAAEGCVEYTVPGDLPDGEYRIVLVGADGAEYGADKVIATSSALVTTGATRATIGSEWTLTGINLDIVTSLKLGDVTISDFVSQTEGEIVFVTPVVAEGNQTLTGTTSNGALMFYVGGALVEEATVAISSETIIWEGHDLISSWVMTFRKPGLFSTVAPGSTLSIYYSIDPAVANHTMRVLTGWWTALPAFTNDDPENNYYLTADGVLQAVLTQADLDLINQQDFGCVGDGYYVDKLTIK
jgi:hypothetical protein